MHSYAQMLKERSQISSSMNSHQIFTYIYMHTFSFSVHEFRVWIVSCSNVNATSSLSSDTQHGSAWIIIICETLMKFMSSRISSGVCEKVLQRIIKRYLSSTELRWFAMCFCDVNAHSTVVTSQVTERFLSSSLRTHTNWIEVHRNE